MGGDMGSFVDGAGTHGKAAIPAIAPPTKPTGQGTPTASGLTIFGSIPGLSVGTLTASLAACAPNCSGARATS